MRAIGRALATAAAAVALALAGVSRPPEAAATEAGGLAGTACAVLTDAGELVMMRSGQEVDPGPGGTVTDVAGAVWEGEVYVVDEDGDLYDYMSDQWVDRAADITSFRVAAGSVVRPHSCERLLADLPNLRRCDLGGLDTSGCRDLSCMFWGDSALEELDAGPLAVAPGADVGDMFRGCRSLRSLDLSGWDLRGARNVAGMLRAADSPGLEAVRLGEGFSFHGTGADLLQLPTPPAEGAFDGTWCREGDRSTAMAPAGLAAAWDGATMAGWWRWTRAEVPAGGVCAVLTDAGELVLARVSRPQQLGPRTEVTDAAGATWAGEAYELDEATPLSGVADTPWFGRRADVTSFRVAPGTVVRPASCAWLLSGLSSLASVDLRGLDTGAATSMRGMFCGCASLAEVDVTPLDTRSVTDMAAMFALCGSLTELDLTSLDVRRVTTMGDVPGEYLDHTGIGMFSCCYRLDELDIRGWDTSSVEDMSAMFVRCGDGLHQAVACLDTTSVRDMRLMFAQSATIRSLDLSGFVTPSLEDASFMLYGLYALERLDVSSMDLANARSLANLVSNTNRSLREVRLGAGFSFAGTGASPAFALNAVPTDAPFDGTWCRDWDASTALTAGELAATWDGSTMAGWWRWTGLEAPTYALSLDLAGGRAPEGSTYPTERSAASALALPGAEGSEWPAPVRHGHSFGGWEDADGNVVEVIPAGTEGDLALTAAWEPLRIEVVVPVAVRLVAAQGAEGIVLEPADPDYTHGVTNVGEAPVELGATAVAGEGFALSAGEALSDREADVWATPVLAGADAAGGGTKLPGLRLSALGRGAVVAPSVAPGEAVWLNGIGGRMGGWSAWDGSEALLAQVRWTVGLAPEE